MTTGAEAPVDAEVLRHEIEKTYREVSAEPDKDFMFPTGRAWAHELGYPEPELARVLEDSAASFAGVTEATGSGAQH
jgi:arsenite methyltransferase